MTFLVGLIAFVVGFALGLWVAQHPDDARSLGEMVAAKLKRLFERKRNA